MALRQIVKEGDSVLTKKCRPVVKFDDRLADLIDDMIETLQVSSNDYEIYPPTYISTIYIFQGDSLLLKTDIPPHILSLLMAVFKSENLISFTGARDDWYAKPRRHRR